jgi:hypothetical protein
LDSLDLPACHFVKADVEGMELSVLRGAEQTLRRHRPLLYVENDRQASSPALIEYLQSLEYDLYWHLPPLFNPRNHSATATTNSPGSCPRTCSASTGRSAPRSKACAASKVRTAIGRFPTRHRKDEKP